MYRYLLMCLTCVAALWSSSAMAELSIEGPCAEGHRWTATMINQGGGGRAHYNQCAPEFDMAYLRCTPGSATVEFIIENAFPDLRATANLTAEVVVDARRYPVTGTAVYSEMAGAGHPIFTLNRNDPLFDAMTQGSRAAVIIDGTTFSMHLAGSSDILPAMFEACP